jgi:hypothetical protein
MTTVDLNYEIQEFDARVEFAVTGAWAEGQYDAFKLDRQAKKGTGFYCRVYRRFGDQLVPAGETLKHLKVEGDQVVIKFDRDYVVGAVK